jgi:hypothetical protein
MDMTWAEAALSIGIGVGLAAAAGLRVFLPLLVLGVASRLELLPLVEGFEWLGSNLGLGALSAATLLEIAAFYVPWIDNLLDVAAGPLAILAGTLATAAVTHDLPPVMHWAIAIVAGGGTAGIVKGVTSVVRLKSSLLTAGMGNFVVATLELVGSLITAILAIAAPVIAFILIAAGLYLCYRATRGLAGRLKPAR